MKSIDSNSALTDPEVELGAGTAWHFAREETDQTLDYLFIDEAGQVSLADALALGTAAKNIVLLGDPQQLPQVSQGAHPKGSSCSALEHMLGEEQTIARDRGVFLDRTWRLHPEITEFCSELMYDGRLESIEGLENQRIVGVAGAAAELEGSGIRWVPVEHEGRSQSSVEEADRIAEMVEALDGAHYVDADGEEHPLKPEDIMVVTPFNAQLKCLEARLPEGVRAGTVDKFQGQEAQIVFFSLATSSGARGSAKFGVPPLKEQAERGRIESEVPGCRGGEPGAVRYRLLYGGADAVGECGLRGGKWTLNSEAFATPVLFPSNGRAPKSHPIKAGSFSRL